MRFYTASKLGSNRGYTPEGFLVCYGVPIARTGEMLYLAEELNQPGQPPLVPGPDGLIRVLRDPDQVFDPDSIASFLGKPTTNDHPPVLVTPENYGLYASGSGLNVRRGEGDQSDLLLADLVFGTSEAIAAVEGGKVEISNGYDADYEQVAPGIVRQFNIRGNHIALVDEGRCGTRCAIGDSAAAIQTTPAADSVLASNEAPSCGCGGGHHRDAKPTRAKTRKIRDMATKKLKGTMLDRLRRAFATKDEAAFEEGMESIEEAVEANEEETQAAALVGMITTAVGAAVQPLADRMDAIEAKTAAPAVVSAETPEEKAAKEAAAVVAKAAEVTTTDTDTEALVAFLKSKGLGDEDIAAAVATVTKDSLEEGGGSNPSDTGPGDPDGGASAPGYNSGSSSMIDEDGPEAKAKDPKMTADAAGLTAIFRDTVARAEILAPGIKLPTYDGKAKAKATADTICALRRDALKRAFASDDRKAHVAPFVTDAAPNFAKLSCGAVKLMFTGASELAKAANNRSARTNDAASRDTTVRSTIADMNKANHAFWNPSKK